MRLTLKSKVLLLAMAPVLPFALVLSGGAVLIPKKQADAKVKDTRECLLGDHHVRLEHYMQIAMGNIQAEYDCSTSGGLNARVKATAYLLEVKYGKDSYTFGYDSQVMRLFRGDNPANVSKSFRGRRDPGGIYLNRELVETGKNGSHYVTYILPLSGNENIMMPKLFYALYLPKWGMVIGSMVNLDGAEAQLMEIKQVIDECIGTLIVNIVTIVGVLLAVLLVIGLAVVDAMLRLLYQIRQSLDDIATGEGGLTRRLPVASHDELDGLADSFNRLVEKIRGLVRQTAGTAGDLKQSVEQMPAQVKRSEQATERQRHETDQVAIAINKTSAVAHEVAQSAQCAAEAAQQIDHEGQTAKRVMDSSIERIHTLMDEVHDNGSSPDSLQQNVQSIASMLGAIHSIAEQTNLLTLDVAVEAARASGAGRGFAVVVDETWTLASHTQQSTQGTQGMIDRLRQGTNAATGAMRRSDEAGEGASNQVNQAGDSLDAIAQSIAAINAMSAQTINAVEKQTVVAEEVSHSVHQIVGAVNNVADEARQGAQIVRSLA